MANSLFGGAVVMDVSVDQLEEAQRGLQEEATKIRDGKKGAMAAAVGQLHRYAANKAPVDTGRLKNSIFPEVLAGGDQGIVATNVSYSIYVEYGTRRMAARRYFGETVDVEGPAAMRTYRSILFGR